MKHMSKIVAVMLAVLMMASMLSMAAFAAEIPSTDRVAIGSFTGGTITINASNADDSFAVYKVIDVSYNSGTNEAAYAFTTAAATYNATLGDAAPTVEQYQKWTNESTELKTYLGGFAAYVKATPVDANYRGQATANVCTITNVALGQYLVLGTGSATGAYVYQLMTATFKPNSDLQVNTGVTLSSKASNPTITKTADDTQVATNDTVTYTIEIAIPTYPAGATNRQFIVSDVLPAEIDYANTTSVKVDSTDLAADTAFTFAQDGKNLTWTITSFDAISAYQKLVIVYTAKVKPDITNVAGATNIAKLTYSNDPYGTGTHDITDAETVYSYGIDVTKVDKETKRPIQGVEFELYKDSADGTKIGGTYTTDEHGKIVINGLDVGTYYLKETKAASGYVLPTDSIQVTITDADKDGKIDVTEGTATTNVATGTIENTKGDYSLPETGGIGTWVFTIIGVCLMASAVALLVAYKKRSDKTN